MGEPAGEVAAVLLVSDRSDLPLLLRGPCAARGLRLAWEPDADRGLGPAADGYRLLLLDAAIAGLNAPEAVRAFRARSSLPVVVISLLTRAADPVETLESGADDYVGGPLDPEEVVARMRAVLRRQRVDRAVLGIAEAGGVRLECSARQAHVDGTSVALTAVEFDLLEHLVRHAGRKVLREDLTRAAWGRQASPLDRSLDVHISRLRRKIACGARIVTVRGVGYMLAVSRLDSPASPSPDHAGLSPTPEW
ncbi:MAG: response regulator transcription factor [Vicinamibacteraceae bacterium]